MSHVSSTIYVQDDDEESQDQEWSIGQMLFMGWDGTEVTPQIRRLIQEFHVGSIILTAKNLKSAQHATKLVQELQTIAYNARHPQPLLIAIDQESGGVNSLFDQEFVCEFPSAMGMAAAGSVDLVYETNKATAEAVKACGINVILGPVLDVLLNTGYQPLGVRSVGDDPKEVSSYGIAAMHGIRDAGLATCGKHFPACGSLDFLGSSLDMPIITQTLEELHSCALVPFRNAIATGGLGCMLISGCGLSSPSMNIPHACLSSQIVDDLLRQDLGFEGVAISECLEMEALSQDIGIQNGAVMAVEAGCDLVMLCRSFDIQLEAIQGLKLGITNGIISSERLAESVSRVRHLKSTCTSWQTALHPPGLSLLTSLLPSHKALSREAYDKSMTIVRDRDGLIPLSKSMQPDEELLLLTPLVKPLPASSLAQSMLQAKEPEENCQKHTGCIIPGETPVLGDEGVFRELGRSLARARRAKLLHTSYTVNGVRPVHENLIERASTIIVVTANASRNLYQSSFAKHVDLMCSMLRMQGKRKSVIIIAVSSPYDFVLDKTIGTYLATFDFTENAMQALVRVLWGECVAQGTLPGTLRRSKKASKSRRNWIVEEYDTQRDGPYLKALLHSLSQTRSTTLKHLASTTATAFELPETQMHQAHFVVRNSSTSALYGFAATYTAKDTGILAAILVDPAKRNLSIGRSLHRRAILHLKNKAGVSRIQLGSSFPGAFPGVPFEDEITRKWFASMGWMKRPSTRLTNLAIEDINAWSVPDGIVANIKQANIAFDLVQGNDHPESDGILALVQQNASPDVVELYNFALMGQKACGIVRAKDAEGSVLGTAVVCAPRSSITTLIPVLGSADEDIGGILAPLAFQRPNSPLVLQALVLMGTRQNKAHKARKTILTQVVDDAYQLFTEMGFNVIQSFEQITCSANTVS
ncbi:hypothetical protein NM208_g2275 [Fusarium decemcellulare]|uniref:Uncharacterized protein n=1 Tax=Fusarium decemcellulare TaxID=57161 RepID=A0ACC1STG5_9HYPO|nr:hypothetical protein NM208_g2275 [Fusarium decemcellulare]